MKTLACRRLNLVFMLADLLAGLAAVRQRVVSRQKVRCGCTRATEAQLGSGDAVGISSRETEKFRVFRWPVREKTGTMPAIDNNKWRITWNPLFTK